ncbi:MAG TPA: TetR/AcrR family transcriptional regulator [Sneathiellales bacterium]|nr:TetR/AcrR family transcriptional regulator [Sneathiellales bacterium]
MKKSEKLNTYHHGDLKTALLDAGEEILSQKGPEAISLREIARACGVSQTAPYRHFSNKEALLVAIAIRAFEEFGHTLRVAKESRSDPKAKLHELGKAYVEYGLNHPHRLRLMFGRQSVLQSKDDNSIAAKGVGFSLLEDTVEELIQGDEKRLKAATIAAWSLVHGFTMLVLSLPNGTLGASDSDHADLLYTMLEMLQHGLFALPYAGDSTDSVTLVT